MEKQHAYKRIEKDLKDGGIKNVLLLYGKEQYLVKWAIGIVLERYTDDACRAFDFFEIEPENATLDGIVESCETLSMFSEKRVVCLPGFPPIAGGRCRGITDSDEKLLAEYMKKVPDSCVLIITSESADRRKKLYKEIAAAGGVYDFEPLEERALKGFIEKRFNAFGKKIKNSVTEEFIKCSGYYHKETDYTLYNLENDIKKTAAHCDGDQIALSDVLETVSGDMETNVFAMVDAVGRNKKDEAFRLLYNLLNSGGNVFQILALLASQFETVLEVKEMRDEGKLLAQMQTVLNIHEFRIKKAVSLTDSYTKDRLKDVLRKIYQVEKNIKNGLMEQVTALEMMMSEV